MKMIKRPSINVPTQKKHLSIYSYTIHAQFVLCGSFQLIVVVKCYCGSFEEFVGYVSEVVQNILVVACFA